MGSSLGSLSTASVKPLLGQSRHEQISAKRPDGASQGFRRSSKGTE